MLPKSNPEMLGGMALRCLLVDDNPGFLETARELLHRGGLEVVGVASNTADALARVAELGPDVALVDVYLGDEDGVELARRLASGSDGVRCPVILISTYAEADLGGVIQRVPVAGFVRKTRLSGAAIRAVLAANGR
jgi:CheY-like chemotaxis protein